MAPEGSFVQQQVALPPRMPAHHTALRCLFLVAMHHGRKIENERLLEADSTNTMRSATRLMREAGFHCRPTKSKTWQDLQRLGTAYPAIAVLADGRWVIVVCMATGPDGKPAAAVLDPADEGSGIVLMTEAAFVTLWSGTLVLCKRRYRLADEGQPFGLRWFMPEILRHRRYFRDIAIASLISNLIGFATPLLFYVMIDKVLPFHSMNTLIAVVLLYVTAVLFDSLLNYVRQSLVIFTSNKIDARLVSRTFEQLLGLPMHFFESNTAGVLARHLQQTEKVRAFLTGRLFQTALDTLGLPVLLTFMAFYSFKLTAVVLFFSLAIASVIAIMIPAFRQNLNQLYAAEGARQSVLVESLHGMRTIKSLAMEQVRKTSWDERVVQSVRRHAQVGRISIFGNVLTSALEKLMQLSVITVGALLMFDGGLSVGTLVAFVMLSGRVTSPLVQIVGLVNEYQETALSVRMLGTVMNHAPERRPGFTGIMPEITGEIQFDDVSFYYATAAARALDRVSFRVEPGQVIGIVGRSGSGKSTVTRLIQGIHTAQEGMIRLGGTDIRHIDLSYLRRNVGVVLQDNFLFRGSIRDNIAATSPNAGLEDIVAAARLAGADEFIDRLPQAYETGLEEGASNLSGGQRQRIAIARALLLRPRLLIFDEATSALDPESESIIQDNLAEIARGRTMVIVSHRLSSLVGSDRILVLDQGRVVDFAPHAALLQRCATYSQLWQKQTHHVAA
jgi:ATP-binding cassette subfamily B protein